MNIIKLIFVGIILLVVDIDISATNFIGLKDTIVIEFDKNNKVMIPNMKTYEPGTDKLLFKAYPEVQRNYEIDFEMSIWTIDGNIMNNELIFEINKDFVINSVEFKFSRALYFYDGDTGAISFATEEFFTDWRQIKDIENNRYKIPGADNAKPFPEIPEGIIVNAEEKIKENPSLDYSEFTGSFVIKVDFKLNGKRDVKEFKFKYLHGD